MTLKLQREVLFGLQHFRRIDIYTAENMRSHCKQNLILLLIGFSIASTAGYVLMEHWLSQFAFRVDLQWWMFALPGILVSMIAILSVSAHSLKASLASPVDSLRNE